MPFEQIKRDFEEEVRLSEPPAFNPETDDAEPAFLAVWMQAEQTPELVGVLAVSLLADRLTPFFMGADRQAPGHRCGDYNIEVRRDKLFETIEEVETLVQRFRQNDDAIWTWRTSVCRPLPFRSRHNTGHSLRTNTGRSASRTN